MSDAYLREGVFTTHLVMSQIVFNEDLKSGEVDTHKSVLQSFAGKKVRMSSKRLKTFLMKGIKCVTCGLEGKFFALERHKVLSEHSDPNLWHLNLYATDPDGKEILMTRDHIIPRSKNGLDTLTNSQTMCEICNTKKGNT